MGAQVVPASIPRTVFHLVHQTPGTSCEITVIALSSSNPMDENDLKSLQYTLPADCLDHPSIVSWRPVPSGTFLQVTGDIQPPTTCDPTSYKLTATLRDGQQGSVPAELTLSPSEIHSFTWSPFSYSAAYDVKVTAICPDGTPSQTYLKPMPRAPSPPPLPPPPPSPPPPPPPPAVLYSTSGAGLCDAFNSVSGGIAGCRRNGDCCRCPQNYCGIDLTNCGNGKSNTNPTKKQFGSIWVLKGGYVSMQRCAFIQNGRNYNLIFS